MSLDAEYILDYEYNPYSGVTPMMQDKKFLEDKYGGKVVFISEFTLYWAKPKSTIDREDLAYLLADRVFEKRDFELLEKIK